MKDADGYEMGNFIATVICDGCEAEIEAVVKGRYFWKGKVGRIKCSECGAVSLPCNVCCGSRIQDCENCPFENAEVVKSISNADRRSLFVKELGDLLARYDTGIERMDLFTDTMLDHTKHPVKMEREEVVRVVFNGGGYEYATVTADSLLAIIEDLFKQHCMY